jgi:hypothetical protein
MLSSAGRLTRGTAIVATAGFVGKAFARKKLLLACSEYERATAVEAAQGFIGIHERVS